MNAVTVGVPRRSVDQYQSVVSCTIEADGHTFDIYYRVSQGALATGSDAFLAAALLPAMRLSAALHIAESVSPRLLLNLHTFQDIMHSWYPIFHKIPIEAAGVATPVQEPQGVACFFSGGVDSFYSALKHRDDITHLIFVRGFDIRLSRASLMERVAASLRQAAGELGKQLIEVETNVRTLLDPYGDWDAHTHGAALASVALAQAQFKKVYIASAQSYSQLVPLGSHPLLNPLWSTEQMQVAHDGCEAMRWEKFASIKDSEIVQRWLRVCSHNPGDAYNCGQCDKCLSVRAFINMVGMEGQFHTFSPLRDTHEFTDMVATPLHRRYMGRFMDYAEKRYADAEIVRELRTALARPDAMTVEEADFQLERRRMQRRIDRLTAQVKQMTTSRSWRLTAPLRAAGKRLASINKTLSGGGAR